MRLETLSFCTLMWVSVVSASPASPASTPPQFQLEALKLSNQIDALQAQFDTEAGTDAAKLRQIQLQAENYQQLLKLYNDFRKNTEDTLKKKQDEWQAANDKQRKELEDQIRRIQDQFNQGIKKATREASDGDKTSPQPSVASSPTSGTQRTSDDEAEKQFQKELLAFGLGALVLTNPELAPVAAVLAQIIGSVFTQNVDGGDEFIGTLTNILTGKSADLTDDDWKKVATGITQLNSASQQQVRDAIRKAFESYNADSNIQKKAAELGIIPAVPNKAPTKLEGTPAAPTTPVPPNQ